MMKDEKRQTTETWLYEQKAQTSRSALKKCNRRKMKKPVQQRAHSIPHNNQMRTFTIKIRTEATHESHRN